MIEEDGGRERVGVCSSGSSQLTCHEQAAFLPCRSQLRPGGCLHQLQLPSLGPQLFHLSLRGL